MLTRIQLSPAPPFDFRGTAHSHGWVVLAPNEWDHDAGILRRVERLCSGKVVSLCIQGGGTLRKAIIDIDVEHSGRLSRSDCQEIERSVSHMFRLDEDLRRFHTLCRKRGAPWTAATRGLGRLLRSPGFFEDIVKTICTTNIQWGGTKRMVTELVEEFGESQPSQPEKKAFPTTGAIAEVDRNEFVSRVRMGYRAPYIHELATRIENRELDLESLEDASVTTAAVKKRLLAIKGIGPYAAASLLMLLGRYDDVPVDSVCRDFVGKKYFPGRKPSDEQLRGVYADWAEWKYLAYWFELWTSR